MQADFSPDRGHAQKARPLGRAGCGDSHEDQTARATAPVPAPGPSRTRSSGQLLGCAEPRLDAGLPGSAPCSPAGPHSRGLRGPSPNGAGQAGLAPGRLHRTARQRHWVCGCASDASSGSLRPFLEGGGVPGPRGSKCAAPTSAGSCATWSRILAPRPRTFLLPAQRRGPHPGVTAGESLPRPCFLLQRVCAPKSCLA